MSRRHPLQRLYIQEPQLILLPLLVIQRIFCDHISMHVGTREEDTEAFGASWFSTGNAGNETSKHRRGVDSDQTPPADSRRGLHGSRPSGPRRRTALQLLFHPRCLYFICNICNQDLSPHSRSFMREARTSLSVYTVLANGASQRKRPTHDRAVWQGNNTSLHLRCRITHKEGIKYISELVAI